MATNYDINYNDKRFTEVESDKKAALSEVEKTYGGMIADSDKFYQDQINASKQWADKQAQIQNEQTDFAIEKVEQQKEQAKKDYTKEQSGAYVDWQKQSNEYGANAEQKAAQGMAGTGYSESSQVSMYNTYQNRVATAREAYTRAVLNYDNAIKEARLQNSSALAEIAAKAQQEQLELALQGFQYKNSLIQAQSDKKMQVDSEYYGRWRDVLTQINTENALAEEVRQHNEAMEEEKRQYNETMALQKAQLAEEQRQFNETMAYNKSKSSGSSGSSGGGGSSNSSGSKISSSKKSNNSNNSSIKKTSSSDNKSTMDSIIDLGYGPISASTLNKKVQSGEVQEYTVNGVTKFKKSGTGKKSGGTKKVFSLTGFN